MHHVNDDRPPAPAATDTIDRPRHPVSPVLMAWVTRQGVGVPRLDAPPVLHFSAGDDEEHQAPRTIPVTRAGLHLVEALGRAAPDADLDLAVDRVVADLGLDDRGRAELIEDAEALREAGLLLDPTAGRPRRSDDRRARSRGDDASADLAEPARPAAADDDAADDADGLIASAPVALPAGRAGFTHLAPDGAVLGHLGADDVLVLGAFVGGASTDEARHRLDDGLAPGISADQVEAGIARLRAANLLTPFHAAPQEQLRQALVQKFEAFAESDAALKRVVDDERERAGATGVRRPVVVAVDAYDIPMLSLGMVMAYAQTRADGALQEHYGFAPLWYTRSDRFADVLAHFDDQPAVFLFSHYTWTEHENLALSRRLKELLPNAITVHGGPNVPKYPDDTRRWFAAHPHVDVAVHGEGEVTLAELLEALVPTWSGTPAGQAPDLSALAEVPGMTVRTPDGLHRTPDRDRIEDLDLLPSPYLGGLFENTKRWSWSAVNLETNRGCPYGCTFCDWGSATLSRIRKFDLERVKAEMEWAAQHGFEVFSLTDANFGILERDVEIAEWAVELNRRHGAPTAFQVNYAKNRIGNLAQIVQILGDAGILTEGLVAVQTFDPGVLKTIRRSNIKLERYDALTSEFRNVGLPLYTDVMVGLPGSTVTTVRNDFQSAIDRELHVKSHPTQLLVNSPMNDPEYRAEHGVVAAPGEHLEQAASYTHDEWVEMMSLRRFFYFAERRGLLRQVATYTRVETGRVETDFYDAVRRAGEDVVAWPQLAYATRVAPDEYIPPGNWGPFLAELGRFCVEVLGVPDDDALDTVLEVQRALLPARGRTFPETTELAHDYVTWHGLVIEAKRRHTDGTWHEQVGRLRDLGPGTLVVHDRDDCCTRVIGQNAQGALGEVIWELDSPVTRPKQLH